MNDDAELLRRYAEEKSQAAFQELVERHLGLVYHAALRQCGGDAHRAEDVAQLVFADLARKARELARRPVLAGWLHTSTRYAAAQAVRSEIRRQAREQEVSRMNEVLAETEPAADWETLRPVIDDVLHALGERDREAVLLRFFEGRGFKEVGARLALSEDAARMRVERALDKMRTALTRRGITSTSVALGVVLAQQAGAALPAGLAASVAGAALTHAAAGTSAAVGWIAFMTANKATAGAVAALAGVLALNVTQQRANARLQVEIETLSAQNRTLAAARPATSASAMAMASVEDAAELARLRAQAAELRKKIGARSGALMNGGILRVGGKVVTRDTPPAEKLEIMYREGRSTPMRAWQTLLDLNRQLSGDEKSRRPFIDYEMLALMFCFDDAARAKADAFLTALPADVRAEIRSPERLVAPVFERWLWKGDSPVSYGSDNDDDGYFPGDPTRAYTSWRVTYASGRTQVERYSFKRFEDGWRYGPLSVADVEQMLALLDPRTGQPKAATEGVR